MKLKFKIQPYQTDAVDAVVDCFAGQVNTSGVTYRIDPGVDKSKRAPSLPHMDIDQTGFRNADIQLSDAKLLENIQAVQHRQNLPLSERLVMNPACKVNLDVEMETGTGKTYCYIKTFFEMHERYGWSKFIVVVPSIAIREGVLKSLEITAEHFSESYGKKARFFAYDSQHLHNLESFSSNSGINVMVINIQAFNATGKDNRRIYEELDDFQSRRPIDVIRSNRPILILDEPQKMEGKKTLEALEKFNPLIIIRYSATHKTTHNQIHRLDALDAYNKKLVKKIAVRGITVTGQAGMGPYLYLESIEVSKQSPVARIEIEVRQGNGIKRVFRRLERGKDLFVESKELDQYHGFHIAQIDARSNTVEFTNGHILHIGEATGDDSDSTIRRIQIREAIRAHLEKEIALHNQGVKVLSLFFIDEVAKYRRYKDENGQESTEGFKGEYAQIFEEEYALVLKDMEEGVTKGGYGPPPIANLREYWKNIPVGRTHNGYFSIDKKSKKMTDPQFKLRGEEAGHSDDTDAYDLILKDKERLLSLEEPVRFIFSHSALREGWDNPNVFVMCMLKRSDSTISRRQEVGRGLRICVNRYGERMDNPETVHDVNVLTVVAGESYKDFVSGLQSEISESLAARPRKADVDYFKGKRMSTESGTVEIKERMAKQIHRYLTSNDYVDLDEHIEGKYHEDRASGNLAKLPEDLQPFAEQIFGLIDSVFSQSKLPSIVDDRRARTNPLNDNFEKSEFQALWSRINQKAVFRVEFDSNELIVNCIKALDDGLRVAPLMYTVRSGVQIDNATDEDFRTGQAFGNIQSETTPYEDSVHSMVSYDLLGKIAEGTQLTRKTIAEILGGLSEDVFKKFKQNPEDFITESSRIINEQKATIIIQRLTYDSIAETHNVDIFTAGQSRQDFDKASEKLKNHIYDYVVTDSKVEREFAKELDASSEVTVYAKLPRGFLIPTPVGDYNPDWAICFKEGVVKHIYFVAETKGSMSSMELRAIEDAKINCAKQFFAEVNRRIHADHVKYDVVDSYGRLMEMVMGVE